MRLDALVKRQRLRDDRLRRRLRRVDVEDEVGAERVDLVTQRYLQFNSNHLANLAAWQPSSVMRGGDTWREAAC